MENSWHREPIRCENQEPNWTIFQHFTQPTPCQSSTLTPASRRSVDISVRVWCRMVSKVSRKVSESYLKCQEKCQNKHQGKYLKCQEKCQNPGVRLDTRCQNCVKVSRSWHFWLTSSLTLCWHLRYFYVTFYSSVQHVLCQILRDATKVNKELGLSELETKQNRK